VSFSARITLAIAAVVVLAVAVVAVVAGSRVRETYLSALRGTLGARIDAIEEGVAKRVQETRTDVERVARSPRLVAVLSAGDPDAARAVLGDEMRNTVGELGAGAGYMLLGVDGMEVTGLGADPAVVGAVRSACIAADGVVGASRTGYIVADGTPREITVVPLMDPVEEEPLGVLATWSGIPLPVPTLLADGTPISVAISVADQVHGLSLDPGLRRQLDVALAATEEDVTFGAGAETALAVRRPLVGSAPAASLVVVAGLATMRQAVAALLVRAAAAAGLAVVVGAVIAVFLGRGLSRPVALIGDAARQVEQGDFAVRVPERGSGELAVLGQRFNRMAAGLEQRERFRRVLDAVADPDVARELMDGALDLRGRTQDVGILFCDIRGFTQLTERMEPAAVIELLNAHMALLTEVAYAHGGTVDKFVGDLIMVTFGAPKTGPDDAQRMVRCALAMLQARRAANAAATQPIEIGIGCAYGSVVAGCMGSEKRLDYTVLGARVNLAARLCSKAPAMRAWIDAGAHDAAGRAVAARALEPVIAKGFSGPVDAYELAPSGEAVPC